MPAKLVAQQPGGLVHVVDELRVFRRGFRDVMVNYHPIRLVEARFKGEVRDPGGPLAQIALLPEIIVVSLQRDVRAEQFLGQPLQQRARQQPVQIAFVSNDDFRFRQGCHKPTA